MPNSQYTKTHPHQIVFQNLKTKQRRKNRFRLLDVWAYTVHVYGAVQSLLLLKPETVKPERVF